MTDRKKHKPRGIAEAAFVHSPRLHVVLYSLLLIATPFVLLQVFLQQAVGELSASRMTLGGLEVPIVPVVGLVLLVAFLIAVRRHLTRLRVVAGFVVLVMVGVAQHITDYYFDHSFFELQQNWHYIAYSIFVFMLYRDLGPRGILLARIMLIAFGLALVYSSFDEAFQMRMANRIFDVSDTAKDVWGVCTGLVFLYLITTTPRELRADWKRVRWPRVSGYLRHPPSVCILLVGFTLIFLSVSSILTEAPYVALVFGLTIAAFLFFFALFHISQTRWGMVCIVLLFVVVSAGQGYFYLKHRSEGIVHNRYGLTVYKGIPITFFDVLLFPDGTFRLVDKKHHFNYRDRTFLLKQKTDIILIGSGRDGKGGGGFAEAGVSHFTFNTFTQKGTQVIILRTPEACRVFNRLRREGKNVLFVLHNTC